MFPNLTRCSTLKQKRPVTDTEVSTGAAVGESGRTCLLVELCVELDGGFAALQPNRTPVRDGLDLHTVAAVDLKTLQIHGAPDLNQQKKKPVIKLSHQNYITV